MRRLFVRDPSLPYEVSVQCFAAKPNLLVGAEHPMRDIIRLENAWVRVHALPNVHLASYMQVETFQDRLQLKGRVGRYGFAYNIVHCPPHIPLHRVRCTPRTRASSRR